MTATSSALSCRHAFAHAPQPSARSQRPDSLQARLAAAEERFPVGGRVKVANPRGNVSEPMTDNKDRVFVVHTEMNPKPVPALNATQAQAFSVHSAWESLPKKQNEHWQHEAERLAECAPAFAFGIVGDRCERTCHLCPNEAAPALPALAHSLRALGLRCTSH